MSKNVDGSNRCLEIEDMPVMPIWHAVDQHQASNVPYFASPSLVEEIHNDSNEASSTPFAFLFSRLFKEITGYNPRRTDQIFVAVKKGQAPRKIVWNENEPFVAAMRSAQLLYLQAKQLPQTVRALSSDNLAKEILEYDLDISWLAGLVGAIEIDGSPKVIVTLNANLPLELIAVRKPSRKMVEEGLTPEREEKTKEQARVMLRKGLPLNKARAPGKFLAGAMVYLREDGEGNEYYAVRSSNGVEKSWEDSRRIRLEIPYHELMEKTMKNALINIGEGIEIDAWDALDAIYQETDDTIIRRALYYISTFKTAFELNRISRDGGGSIQAVAIEDVGAYQFLLYISLLFPAALRPVQNQPQKFTSPVGPLLWTVRDVLKAKLAGNSESVGWEGIDMEDRMLIGGKPRVAFEHQTSSVNEMIETHERGIRGHFILLDVGLGKCLDPMTPVLLWDGSTKMAKDIIDGDLVIGDDNKPRTVMGVCKGTDPMYKITQIKGDSYTVNEPHILTLKYSGHKGYFWEDKYNRWITRWMDKTNRTECSRIFTVQGGQMFKTQLEAKDAMMEFRSHIPEIDGISRHKKFTWSATQNRYIVYFCKNNRIASKGFIVGNQTYLGTKEEAHDALQKFRATISDDDTLDISVKDFLTLPKNFQAALKGFKVGVDFPARPVFIDPYVLGAWLGDGDSSGNGFTNIDQPIIDVFQNYVESLGCKWIRTKECRGTAIHYDIRDPIPRKTNAWIRELRTYELCNNKHIPRSYLNNNRETRLQLLAGLLDTNGYYAGGGYEITKVNKRLADDILYLVRSLGFSGVQREVEKACVKPDGTRVWGTYHLWFSGEGIQQIPCKLERKQAHPRQQIKDALSTDIQVEYVGIGEYCGFTVDGNGRFLLGDFTVTHNTFVVLMFIKHLLQRKELPDYIIYSLPSSAILSVCEEILAVGLEINLMIPLKTKKHVDIPKGVKITYSAEPIQGMVNLIDHEHLRKAVDELSVVAGDSLVIFDEVHKFLGDTQKTGAALQISRLSKEFIVLTGTPVIDNKIYRLIPWLEQIVAFEVNERNFWCAATIMVSRKASTGIRTVHEYAEASFTPDEEKRYKKSAPIAMNGENTRAGMNDLKDAIEVSYRACDREMIKQTWNALKRGDRVMIVAATAEHQEKLRQMLVKEGVKGADISILTGKNSIFLTAEAVKAKKIPGYKVVITTIRHSAGYTLTYLNVFISGIYPSNQATRTQLEGRINRLGSKFAEILYIYVHAGALTYIMENHDQARSIEMVLREMGKSMM